MINKISSKQKYMRMSTILFLFMYLAIMQGFAQQVKFVWDNANSVYLAFGDNIKIRVLSTVEKNQNQHNRYNFIFGEDLKNQFREPNQGRYLLQRFVKDYDDTYPPDNSSNEGAIILNQSNKNEAIINFVKSTDQSDLDNFAIGYGLYFFCIDIPQLGCDPNATHSFSRVILPIDFRDSRYTNSYGLNQNIEIHFALAPYHDPNEVKNCGPVWPFQDSKGVDAYIKITSPREIILTPDVGASQYQQYELEPQFIENIFMQGGESEYNFTIENQFIGADIDSDHLPDYMSLYLTHQVILKQNNFELDYNKVRNLIIQNVFELNDDNNIIYSKDRDVTIYVENRPSFTVIHTSVVPPVWDASGMNGSKQIKFRHYQTTNNYHLSGLIFSGILSTTFNNCDINLDYPIKFIGSNAGYIFGAHYKCLDVKNSLIKVKETDPSYFLLLEPKAGITLENVTFSIKNCTIVGTSSWIEPSTGLRIKGNIVESELGGASPSDANIIENFGGHGIELINLAGFTGLPSKSILFIAHNSILNNKMYGAHLRLGDTNPFFYYNHFENNGFIDEYQTVDNQARQMDAVNIQQASGVFNHNEFVHSGAYGLHASWQANPSGSDQNNSSPYNNIEGSNCFDNNYFNLGGNGGSKINFGMLNTNIGGANSFLHPRSNLPPMSYKYQVTLNNDPTANPNDPNVATEGNLTNNKWVDPPLTQNPFPIAKYNYSKSSTAPEYLGILRCSNDQAQGSSTNDTHQHQSLVDSIYVAMQNNDWITAKTYSIQLLSMFPEPTEATIATSTLTSVFSATGDISILQYLYNLAMDRNNQITSLAGLFYSMKAYNIAHQYNISMSVADSLANWYPYTYLWKIAYLNNTFILYDIYNNQSAAEELLLSLLNYYPNDSQILGAYYSVMGKLPSGFIPKKGKQISYVKTAESILQQNFPNPFNPITTISYSLPEAKFVKIILFDALGNEIKTLINGFHNEGTFAFRLNAIDLRPGIYFYKMITDDSQLIKSLVVLR